MLSTLQCVYNYLLCFYISPFRFPSKQLRMCVLSITVWRQVIVKFLRTKLFFVKFQTFSLQAFNFPSSLIPNTQTRHFLWSPIQKAMKFRKGDNSSRWSLYADQEQLFKMFYKIGALETSTIFTGKRLRRSNFKVYKLIGWDPTTFT